MIRCIFSFLTSVTLEGLEIDGPWVDVLKHRSIEGESPIQG